MKELIERWRAFALTAHAPSDAGFQQAAADLEQYLASLWTTITDDPGSLPEVGREILVYTKLGIKADVIEWRPVNRSKPQLCKYYEGWRWRYFGIPGIDYPDQPHDE